MPEGIAVFVQPARGFALEKDDGDISERRGATRRALERLEAHMTRRLSVVLDETSPAQLLQLLVDGQMVEAQGWVLSAEDNPGAQATHFWVTSPYGNDCAYVPLTEAGAERMHTMITNHVDQGELEHF